MEHTTDCNIMRATAKRTLEPGDTEHEAGCTNTHSTHEVWGGGGGRLPMPTNGRSQPVRNEARCKVKTISTGIQTKILPSLGPTPLCDIPSGCCFFTGPWTVTRSSHRMLRRVAAFCRPLRPVLLLVLFPRSRSPVVDVLGLC